MSEGHIIKEKIACISAGAAIAVGSLVGAGLASASVDGFLQEMGTPSASNSELLAEGNSFCAALDRGREQHLTGRAAANIITNFSEKNASQGRAGSFGSRLIVTAVKELCPANHDFLVTAAQAYDAQGGGQ